ncbi:hypothetical protein RHGRI_016136 [Rhododendron griersonianum]|uniref:Uncharacterized protein n=1 Tax=Rhododendron griersonianum TaxID=479676 RepID=A0AAV6JSR7_9ERIC|nr:hypothetical protein RHGRI_016136 [Rhododendron griersonianum]
MSSWFINWRNSWLSLGPVCLLLVTALLLRVCAFASTSQYLKFIVSYQFGLNPAELNGRLPHRGLMEDMLAVPGNTYGLNRSPDTGDCSTSPITILRDHLEVVSSPRGPLIFPSIHTLRSVQNVQNIGGGVRGG